eukprot:scaffold4735_cov403-Prasinococcus_capsulatus_cf.AAC.2
MRNSTSSFTRSHPLLPSDSTLMSSVPNLTEVGGSSLRVLLLVHCNHAPDCTIAPSPSWLFPDGTTMCALQEFRHTDGALGKNLKAFRKRPPAPVQAVYNHKLDFCLNLDEV